MKSQQSDMKNQQPDPELSTRKWVEEVIVGLNFCPFAKREVVRNSIRYTLLNVSGQAPQDKRDVFFKALDALLDEFRYLDQNEKCETTLVIFPELLTDFEDFLDFLMFAEKLLLDEGYEGVYQLAHFHPDYCFEGSEESDPANYTNRSPYPTLHIIREASMEKVLANISNPEEIPERNIRLARDLGKEKLTALLKACMSSHH
jgi:hypothetical protein